MAIDFSKFDKEIDVNELNKQIATAKENSVEVPNGDYWCKVDKMELRETKDHRPMFFIQLRINEGDQKNRCLFMNKVVYGTKNDGAMIQAVQTLLDKFECDVDTTFKGYSDFAEVIADIYEEVGGGNGQVHVDWDSGAFNSISIIEACE